MLNDLIEKYKNKHYYLLIEWKKSGYSEVEKMLMKRLMGEYIDMSNELKDLKKMFDFPGDVIDLIKWHYPSVKKLNLTEYISKSDTFVLKGYGIGMYPMKLTVENDLTEILKIKGYECLKFSAVDDECTWDKLRIEIKKI